MASTKAKVDKRYADLDNHFTKGNIVYSAYWRAYDKVIGYSRTDGSWFVIVRECDKDGNITGEVRNHSTYPDFKRGDKVISSVAVEVL